MYSWRRPPTPYARTDAEDNESGASASPRSSSPVQFLDSWRSDAPSRGPSPFERVIPPPPHTFNTPSPPPPFQRAGYTTPPHYPSLGPTLFPAEHYPPGPPPTPYPYPPRSDHESISRRSASSTHTHARAPRKQEHVEGDRSGRRTFDSIPCQICLQPPAVCSCVGGEEARFAMRRAAYDVYRKEKTSEGRRASGHTPQPQVARQPSMYVQGYEHGIQYGAQAMYPGSPVAVYSGTGMGIDGYALGYGAPPMFSPASPPY